MGRHNGPWASESDGAQYNHKVPTINFQTGRIPRDLVRSFVYGFYRLLTLIAFPLLLIYIGVRVFRNRAYARGLPERFGFPNVGHQASPGAIWIHSVSVGEVLGALEVIELLRARLPGERIFVSCSTVAGRELAEKRLRVDGIFYLPFDYTFAVRRVLRLLRPTLVVVMETEVWPNLFREVKRTHASLVIVNARISDRALVRYRRIKPFVQRVLPLADGVLAQSDENARRYRELGAKHVIVGGNLKYDFRPSERGIPEAVGSFIARMNPEAIWIAASTMPPLDDNDVDEDDVVIGAWKRIATPSRLLILVPRKPERFDVAASKLRKHGVDFVRRTELRGDSRSRVLLLDTIGELSSLFALPAVVFMGGTLARRGGHNILEPAYFGRPIITGPNMQNFAEIAHCFRDSVEVIQRPTDLADAVERLMTNDRGLGARAKALVESERGATRRIVDVLVDAYEAAVPVYRPAQPAFAVLWCLSKVWIAGGWIKRCLANSTILSAPVISVGGITMGGAGKTPLVRWLTHRYAQFKPAVLTRGYGRRSKALVVAQPGESASVADTGDEAQMYLRDGIAAVAIFPDRITAARQLAHSYKPGFFILDDGFQHAQVTRETDLLVLDARDPFGGGFVFPLGWMREPLAAISRATSIVIARAESHRTYAGVAALTGQPVARATLVAERWVNIATGELQSPTAFAGRRARVVAAIANPDSFLRTVAALGVEIESAHIFPDHHQYSERDLTQVAESPHLVLTTEKDAVKMLSNRYHDLWYLRVAFDVQGLPPLLVDCALR